MKRKEWSYSISLESNKFNDDVFFDYMIEKRIKIKSISVNAWIYTDNPDRYEAYINSVIKLNGKVIKESPIETTTQGTAWSSCIYEFNKAINSGYLTIETIGNNFKKGLNIVLRGYENGWCEFKRCTKKDAQLCD